MTKNSRKPESSIILHTHTHTSILDKGIFASIFRRSFVYSSLFNRAEIYADTA